MCVYHFALGAAMPHAAKRQLLMQQARGRQYRQYRHACGQLLRKEHDLHTVSAGCW
jgi:hypothetical protein